MLQELLRRLPVTAMVCLGAMLTVAVTLWLAEVSPHVCAGLMLAFACGAYGVS